MSTVFSTEELLKVTSQLNNIKPNKLLEITNYWHIEGDGEFVSFTAYDGTNFLNVALEHKGKLDVMVRSEQLSKLIEKTTSPKIKLTQTDGALKLEGNGEYFLDIVSDDEEFPTFTQFLPEDINDKDPLELKTTTFVDVSNINSSAVSKSDADGIYTGFLLRGGQAITTDIIKVCISKTADLGEQVLISPAIMNILSSLSDEDLFVWVFDSESFNGESRKAMLITSASCEIYGPLMDGVDEYVDVTELSKNEFPGSVELSTVDCQSVLDRLSLFMNVYDKGTVNLVFDKKNLRVSTNTKSYEEIPYTDAKGKSGKAKEFSCQVNSLLLKDILSTVSESNFVLDYGNDQCIHIVSNKAEYFLALQEQDDENE